MPRDQEFPSAKKAFAMYSMASALEERGDLDGAEKHSSTTVLPSTIAIRMRYATSRRCMPISALSQERAATTPLAYLSSKKLSMDHAVVPALTVLLRCSFQDYAAGALLHSGQAHAGVLMMEDALPRWRKAVKPGPSVGKCTFLHRSRIPQRQ